MNYQELLKYNFGNKENFSKIALLDEVLSLINNNKIILIEVKEESDDFKELVDIVFNIINKYQLNIYIMSFNYELIKYFKTKYNKCGLVIGMGLNTKKLYNNFNFNVVSYNYRNKVEMKETFIWTINEVKEDIHKFNIITDKPYLFNTNN